MTAQINEILQTFAEVYHQLIPTSDATIKLAEVYHQLIPTSDATIKFYWYIFSFHLIKCPINWLVLYYLVLNDIL